MILAKTFLPYYQISKLTFNFEISLFTVSTIIINLKEKATHAPPGSRQEVLPFNPYLKCPARPLPSVQQLTTNIFNIFFTDLAPLNFA